MHHFLAFEDSIAIVRNRNQTCEDLAAWFLSVVTHRHTHTHTLCFTYNGGVGKILKSKSRARRLLARFPAGTKLSIRALLAEHRKWFYGAKLYSAHIHVQLV